MISVAIGDDLQLLSRKTFHDRKFVLEDSRLGPYLADNKYHFSLSLA